MSQLKMVDFVAIAIQVFGWSMLVLALVLILIACWISRKAVTDEGKRKNVSAQADYSENRQLRQSYEHNNFEYEDNGSFN